MNNLNKRQILVVDDDAMNREVMEAFLLSEGYEVLLASNGQDGLNLAHEYQPSTIILDVRMPDISGYAVCEKLKQSGETKNIPIMIMTGFDAREDYERGKAAGADEFLTRPFDGDDLLNRIHKLVFG
ncbi:MAG: hypothetical protein Phog2KO_09280 [Phototrophicaceae bacterium]